jgi:hypothetical protein
MTDSDSTNGATGPVPGLCLSPGTRRGRGGTRLSSATARPPGRLHNCAILARQVSTQRATNQPVRLVVNRQLLTAGGSIRFVWFANIADPPVKRAAVGDRALRLPEGMPDREGRRKRAFAVVPQVGCSSPGGSVPWWAMFVSEGIGGHPNRQWLVWTAEAIDYPGVAGRVQPTCREVAGRWRTTPEHRPAVGSQYGYRRSEQGIPCTDLTLGSNCTCEHHRARIT